jgi:hypothetical protein
MIHHLISLAALLAAATTATAADSRIDTLCGANHQDEQVMSGDASANPGGYYVASLKVQLRQGDPRIITSNDATFHLCTRPAATPDMETTKALLLMNERTVKYLFVPMTPQGTRRTSDVSG